MSERQEAQHELASRVLSMTWPDTGARVYDAPYGVVEGMHTTRAGGKVRTVLFGVRRHLDAMAYVFRPDRVVVYGTGSLAAFVNGDYDSVDDVVHALTPSNWSP